MVRDRNVNDKSPQSYTVLRYTYTYLALVLLF